MNIRNIIENDLISLNNKEYIYEKVNDKYESIRFNEFINKSKDLAEYLIENNLKNKRILLIGKNSINYLIADLAITIYTGVCVNIDKDINDDLLNTIKSLRINAIIYDNYVKDKVRDINIFKLNIDEFKYPKYDTYNFKEYSNTKCSKIFFSSGTTSKAKGIKLSIKNMFAGWNSLQRRTPFTKDDIIYLFLPLHHTYANIYNFYYSLLSGLSIYLSSGVNNIFKELAIVNPTIFCGVPLIYERALNIFNENIKSAFGSNIKYLYVGGAPLSIDIKKIYKDNNLELLNAYALTETASSLSIAYPKDKLDDSVGTIFEDLSVKIIDKDENNIGEIVVKGDAVFLGYTKKINDIYTEDGYFKTGDLGLIKNNKLYLKGRKKKVLIGSNGENIYIDEIKDKLKNLDSNINYINVSLKNNKVSVILYLKDKELTDIDKLIDSYNNKCTKKNKIYYYEISDKTNYEKLIS